VELKSQRARVHSLWAWTIHMLGYDLEGRGVDGEGLRGTVQG